ncbi:acireductone synthase [Lujinxingia litoralis]|uniref:Enolase-phosphatase E1 n=1 Tax=Lujinxingia litoralis TaxID=2211119 RepID=A0A328CC27_9DELT|nr:acireductone synthase [Lujinxingia litoralis]RAL23087.1 acireductone synthase [Lujinxingia litoralis]
MTTLSYRAALLDIEGTTTPVTFVYDVLFPYARAHAEAFLKSAWERPEVQDDIALLRDQARQDAAGDFPDAPQIPDRGDADTLRQAALANIHWQMDADRKTTGLKSLQGKIWKDGYAAGTLTASVYPDVFTALRRWHEAKLPTYIYSSGSVAAQKLLFGHTEEGDLRPLLAGYFDTTTGPKKVAQSYRDIADEIGVPTADVLFVTDNLHEAIAAREAGMQTRIALRPGNAPLPEHDHLTLTSFDALFSPAD